MARNKYELMLKRKKIFEFKLQKFSRSKMSIVFKNQTIKILATDKKLCEVVDFDLFTSHLFIPLYSKLAEEI